MSFNLLFTVAVAIVILCLHHKPATANPTTSAPPPQTTWEPQTTTGKPPGDNILGENCMKNEFAVLRFVELKNIPQELCDKDIYVVLHCRDSSTPPDPPVRMKFATDAMKPNDDKKIHFNKHFLWRGFKKAPIKCLVQVFEQIGGNDCLPNALPQTNEIDKKVREITPFFVNTLDNDKSGCGNISDPVSGMCYTVELKPLVEYPELTCANSVFHTEF